MGNDGGSIPTRRELVKEAAKDPSSTQVKEVQTEKLEHYWSHCALSQKPLSLPIVSDSTGNLYNKDAVLEYLLGSGKNGQDVDVAGNDRTVGTIKSLRDIVEVRFSLEDKEEDKDSKDSALRLVCPVSGKRLGPGVKAVYLVPCGHAFAESAVKELPGQQCLQCSEPYSADNMIPILPASAAEKDRLRARLLKLQSAGLTHSLKKVPGSGRKRKKDKSTTDGEVNATADVAAGPAMPPQEEATTLASSTNAIRNADTASLTAKVLAEQEDRNKRRKMAQNENLKTLFSSSDGMAGKQKDFMTRGFSISAEARRLAKKSFDAAVLASSDNDLARARQAEYNAFHIALGWLKMKPVSYGILLVTVAQAVLAAEPSRPRGVGPEHAKFYKSTDIFTCISNPSTTLSPSQINDDYCDCPDGSDEPGTSACSYLSDLSPSYASDLSSDNVNRTIALPGFYCKNKGHQPSYVPFYSVNDGVCDYDICCDGSEEWAQVGGLKCENRCNEIGKAWRKQDEQRKKSLGVAGKKRKELVAEAGRLRKEVEDRIQTLEAEIQGTTLKVKSLETALADAERQERGKVVRSAGKGGKVGTLIQMAKDRIEELRESLMEVRLQRDDASARLAELEDLLTTFKTEYNPNFNDEGVKRAVRSWEEYAAREKPAIGDAAHDRDLDEISKPDSETGVINWSDWEEKEEGDTDVLYKIEEYLPVAVRGWVDQKLRDLRILLIENGILAASTDTGSESKHLTDARDALKAAQDTENSLRNELTGHQDDLAKDYGVDDVFRALKGQCVSKDSGEYNYELCWLDRTTQKSRKGGSHTGMGNFARIDSVTVDDDLPPDGKGLGSGVRTALRYENGQHCWNGPSRSTLVVLGCAEQDEIWKITEEEKCVYRMEVGTPAACEVQSNGKGVAKDEL